MARVVQEARQQLQGEWSEWSAPVWRRPSRGPGSRSQSADPALGPALLPVPPLPVPRSAPRAGTERLTEVEDLDPAKHPGPGRLLKPRSRSQSSEKSSASHAELAPGHKADEVDDELASLERQLQDKQRQLDRVRADGSVLVERLEATERNAKHFGEAVAILEAGLQDATREEGAPHRELRQAPGASDPGRTQAIHDLVDEWSRARAALGLV